MVCWVRGYSINHAIICVVGGGNFGVYYCDVKTDSAEGESPHVIGSGVFDLEGKIKVALLGKVFMTFLGFLST